MSGTRQQILPPPPQTAGPGVQPAHQPAQGQPQPRPIDGDALLRAFESSQKSIVEGMGQIDAKLVAQEEALQNMDDRLLRLQPLAEHIKDIQKELKSHKETVSSINSRLALVEMGKPAAPAPQSTVVSVQPAAGPGMPPGYADQQQKPVMAQPASLQDIMTQLKTMLVEQAEKTRCLIDEQEKRTQAMVDKLRKETTGKTSAARSYEDDNQLLPAPGKFGAVGQFFNAATARVSGAARACADVVTGRSTLGNDRLIADPGITGGLARSIEGYSAWVDDACSASAPFVIGGLLGTSAGIAAHAGTQAIVDTGVNVGVISVLGKSTLASVMTGVVTGLIVGAISWGWIMWSRHRRVVMMAAQRRIAFGAEELGAARMAASNSAASQPQTP